MKASIVLISMFALTANCLAQSTAPSTKPFVRTPVKVPANVTLKANIQYDKYEDCVLDVMYPAAPSAQKRPGVVVFHGGGWIQSNKESTMTALCLPYLSQGFVVCNVEYRCANTGRSPAKAPAAVVDSLNATKWFVDHADDYGLDVNKLVITGASAGGHLALMVGMVTPEANLGPVVKCAAIVNCYGPPDVNDLITKKVDWAVQWLPDQPGREDLETKLSPMTYIRANLPPILTVQGENDHTVPTPENVKLNWELKLKGNDSEEIMIPGAGHGPGRGQWPDTDRLIFNWLVKHGIYAAVIEPGD